MFEKTVAVVIPISRSLVFLRDQVNSLMGQLVNQESRTLVLSFNSADLFAENETQQYLKGLAASGVNLIAVRAFDTKNAAYARNLGWNATNAELVLFCDDDDQVSDSWIDEMVSYLEGSDLVGGSLDVMLLNKPALAEAFSKPTIYGPNKFDHLLFAPTCNLGVKRRVLEVTGGFDETLKNGEDIDFCWRAQYLGFAFMQVIGATVHYRLRPTFARLFDQYYVYGKADGPMLVKHRAFGARRYLKRTLYDLLALTFALVLFPAGATRRYSFAQKLGSFCGHLVGTFKSRVWII